MRLENVKAIVTGGVSGLGLSVAEHVIAHGGKVALFDVNDDKGAQAVTSLGADKTIFLRTDVSDEEGVRGNVAAAADFLGGLNVAVSCAGILGAGRMLGRDSAMPLKTFSDTVMVNLVGSFNVAKAVAERMQNNDPGDDGERGVIVNTASVAAFEGQIGQAAYSASKAGVIGMTLPMARELARFGIRVMTIAPGIFWTPMVDGMPESVRQSLSASIPFPSRLGRSNEFAELVAHIIGNRYLNGETIRLDGAVRLAPK